MSKYIDSEHNDYVFDFIQQEWDSRTSFMKSDSLCQLFKIATVTHRGYSFDLEYKDCLNGLILLNEIMGEAESKFSGQFKSSYLLQLNSCTNDNSLIINLTSPSSEELMVFSSNGILLPRKFTEFFPKDILMLFHE